MNFPSSSLLLSPLLRKQQQQPRFHVSWTLKTKPQDDKNRKKRLDNSKMSIMQKEKNTRTLNDQCVARIQKRNEI